MTKLDDMNLTLNAKAAEGIMAVRRENAELKARVAELKRETNEVKGRLGDEMDLVTVIAKERDGALARVAELEADARSLDSVCEAYNSRCAKAGRDTVDLQVQLARAKVHTGNLEESNEALQLDRDELKILRDYLRQEYGRPPFIESHDDNADGPAAYAIGLMNQLREQLDRAWKTRVPGRVSELEDNARSIHEAVNQMTTALGLHMQIRHHGTAMAGLRVVADALGKRALKPRSMSEAPREKVLILDQDGDWGIADPSSMPPGVLARAVGWLPLPAAGDE